MAGNVFKVTVIQYWLYDCWIGPDGKPCGRDAPGARFVKARKVPAGTPGAERVKTHSSKWYGRVPGARKPVPLSTNRSAAQIMLGEKLKNTEMHRAGAADPFEEHSRRPLAEHLTEWGEA